MQENKFYGQFRADEPLELEPIIVEIANADRSQGKHLTIFCDLLSIQIYFVETDSWKFVFMIFQTLYTRLF